MGPREPWTGARFKMNRRCAMQEDSGRWWWGEGRGEREGKRGGNGAKAEGISQNRAVNCEKVWEVEGHRQRHPHRSALPFR